MAAYVKQADQVVLIFSKAEAIALRDLVAYGEDVTADQSINNSTREARERSVRAIRFACEPRSRGGAVIE